jgi:hypothetical protein
MAITLLMVCLKLPIFTYPLNFTTKSRGARLLVDVVVQYSLVVHEETLFEKIFGELIKVR